MKIELNKSAGSEFDKAVVCWKDQLPKEFVSEISFEAEIKKLNFEKHIDGERIYFALLEKSEQEGTSLEKARLSAFSLNKMLNTDKQKGVSIESFVDAETSLAFAEGLALSNYQFLKYFEDVDKRKNSLTRAEIIQKDLSQEDIDRLNASVHANFEARTLVNEPLSYLTAEQLSREVERLGKENGFRVEVFNKKKIESLKMGGLLAVNIGAVEPPTFNIMEYKPENPVNSKPFVLVGKGVVYDTGGLSLKPTANSMDFMKCDMGGAAAVIGAMVAIAKAKLNVHVVCLVPATENRPGGNAYAPGDVIKMFNGLNVEVLNTDAEGRMILADALAYAIKYDPELVFDFATLTGAAARAIGGEGVVAMGTAEQKDFDELSESGFKTYERIAHFPFWEEYGQQIKSDIADIKNLGGPEAGMITAGKFLEHFTKKDGKHAYPWIHVDIAGPAYNFKAKNYRGVQGSGVGVRLLFDFFCKKSDA